MMLRQLKYPALLIAGAMNVLAFAPYHIPELAIIAPACLFLCWAISSPRQAFWQGIIYGLGFFGFGLHWLYISLNHFAHSPMWLTALLLFALMLIVSLGLAIPGWLINKLINRQSSRLLLAYPAAVVLFEYLRSHAPFTGLPWLIPGFSMTNTWLIHWAPIIGVYGVSLILLFMAGVLAYIVIGSKRHLKYLGIGIALALTLGGFAFGFVQWTTPMAAKSVALIQGNIPQSLKWQPSQVPLTIARYTHLTARHWRSIVVWPESAIPVYRQTIPGFISQLQREAYQHHSALITGIPSFHISNNTYYNSMIVVGRGHGEHNKHELVPFAEYFPMPSITGFILKRLHMPMSGFTPGKFIQKPLIANGIKVTPMICYEIAYTQHVALNARNTNLLVTISDDSWFGQSFAAAQHQQIAAFQSAATQKPQLFVSNSSRTSIISKDGTVLQQLPSYMTGVLISKVVPNTGNTPLMSWGMWVFLVLIILMLSSALYYRRADV